MEPDGLQCLSEDAIDEGDLAGSTRSAFNLARGCCTLVPADALYFFLDEVTPGARLV